jgi:pSer/pThr/pTyr-binding forkhead associated (FHA) protein
VPVRVVPRDGMGGCRLGRGIGMKAYTIGRGRKADIVIGDTSVSRIHAELVSTDDGRLYLTDCGSKFGTFIQREAKWKQIRQVYVRPRDPVKLGQYETSAAQLLELLPEDKRRPRITIVEGEVAASPKSDLPSGPVERDPETGEIIRRTV